MAKFKIPTIFLLIGLIIFLSQVFSGSIILPQTLSIGPIVIHYYGLIMALAVLIGWITAKKRAVKFDIDPKAADDIIFWLIVGGFLGARVYHVLSSAGYYGNHFFDVFKVWNGGLSIYGAVVGGCLTLLIYRALPHPFSLSDIGEGRGEVRRLLDWLTPSIIIGQILGRFGNLFNYEAYGYPTNLPWKMFVPPWFRPDQYQGSVFFHPWFLYEQIGLLIIFLIIQKIGKSKKPLLFFWYLLLYNILRFGLEFLRTDSTFIAGLRLNSITSLILISVASFIIFLRMNKNDVNDKNVTAS